jgi:hypothetical protein
MRISPPPLAIAHHSSSTPPPSSNGADHASRSLMPSRPRMMIATWASQNTPNAIQMLPGTPVHPGHAAASSDSSASAPIHVWIPNQPHATIARSTAGTLAPFTPNAARHSTGKDTPYFVPAWAFRIMGTRTMALPSRMVTSACH